MTTRLFRAALLLLAGTLASVAQAGVAGNDYVGLLTLANDQTGISNASFGSESWVFSRQFVGDPQPTVEGGRFSEIDLFVISIWEATLVTPGSETVRPVNGIAFFGVVTTVNFPGRNGTPLATGIYVIDDGATPISARAPFAPAGDVPAFSAGCLACPADAVLRPRGLRLAGR